MIEQIKKFRAANREMFEAWKEELEEEDRRQLDAYSAGY